MEYYIRIHHPNNRGCSNSNPYYMVNFHEVYTGT